MIDLCIQTKTRLTKFAKPERKEASIFLCKQKINGISALLADLLVKVA